MLLQGKWKLEHKDCKTVLWWQKCENVPNWWCLVSDEQSCGPELRDKKWDSEDKREKMGFFRQKRMHEIASWKVGKRAYS